VVPELPEVPDAPDAVDAVEAAGARDADLEPATAGDPAELCSGPAPSDGTEARDGAGNAVLLGDEAVPEARRWRPVATPTTSTVLAARARTIFERFLGMNGLPGVFSS
jgi:hypothetical protein